MKSAPLLSLLCFMVVEQFCLGWSTPRQPAATSSSRKATTSKATHQDKTPSSNWDRRSLLSGLGISMVSLLPAEPVYAKDAIFKANPLTNPVLEQIRIWEQAEADNIKYNGELEAGDAGNKGKVNAYPKLLLPILQMDSELSNVKLLVRDEASWTQALAVLEQPQYQKINFKRVFNAFSDNIYYSDPDRANVYLGGGATPKTEQSLAYLLRNDILTNVENLRAELEYLLKSGDTEVEDLYKYAAIAESAMKKYLAIVPPGELKAAREILKSET